MKKDIVDETLTKEEVEEKKYLVIYIRVFILSLIFIVVSLFFKSPYNFAVLLSIFSMVTSKYLSNLRKDKTKKYILYYTIFYLMIISFLIFSILIK